MARRLRFEPSLPERRPDSIDKDFIKLTELEDNVEYKSDSFNINDAFPMLESQTWFGEIANNVFGDILKSSTFYVYDILLTVTFLCYNIYVASSQMNSNKLVNSIFLFHCLTVFLVKLLHSVELFFMDTWNVYNMLIMAFCLNVPEFSFLLCIRLLKILRDIPNYKMFQRLEVFRGILIVISTIANAVPDVVNVSFLMILIAISLSNFAAQMFISIRHFSSYSHAVATIAKLMMLDGWLEVNGAVLHHHTNHTSENKEITIVFSYLVLLSSVYTISFVLSNFATAIVFTHMEMNIEKAEMEEGLFQEDLPCPTDKTCDGLQGSEETLGINKIIEFTKFSKMARQSKHSENNEIENLSEKWLLVYEALIIEIQENVKRYTLLRKELKVIQEKIYRSDIKMNKKSRQIDGQGHIFHNYSI